MWKFTQLKRVGSLCQLCVSMQDFGEVWVGQRCGLSRQRCRWIWQKTRRVLLPLQSADISVFIKHSLSKQFFTNKIFRSKISGTETFRLSGTDNKLFPNSLAPLLLPCNPSSHPWNHSIRWSIKCISLLRRSFSSSPSYIYPQPPSPIRLNIQYNQTLFSKSSDIPETCLHNWHLLHC